MASPEFSQLAHSLALEVQKEQWLNYTLIPSVPLLVFDWLLTFDLEVSLVWSAPRSGMKLLFLLNRYLPFIDIPLAIYFEFGHALPQHVCKRSFEIMSWMFVIGHSFAVAILTTRTWAACGKSKRSTYGLFGAFVVLVASTFTLCGLYLRSSIFAASPFPQLFGCIVFTKGSIYIASMNVILMFYDGGLLLLMISRGVSELKAVGKSGLSRVVFRDGILYYAYIFGLLLLNAVVIFRVHDPFETLLVPLERVTYSVLACWVVLHIREQGEREKRGAIPSEQFTEPLRFAQATQITGFVRTGTNEESDC